MRLFEFDHWQFTKELWDYHQQHLNQINQQTLVSLQQQGFFIAIPDTDPTTFTALQAGEVESVLLESRLARWIMRALQPNNMADLLILVAFLRLPYFYQHYSAFQTLSRRKAQAESQFYWPEKVQAILRSTYGLPLYVEQSAELIVTLTGYPLEICYSLLQRLKRKNVDFTQDIHAFLEAAKQHGTDLEIAWEVFALLVEFTPDAVYRSSLEAYVKPVYESAYLQTHYWDTYESVKAEVKQGEAKFGA